MKNIFTWALGFIVVHELLNSFDRLDGVGAIRAKSRFMPPYSFVGNEIWRSKTNFAFAQHKAGCYIIKEKDTGIVVYVGASGSNVYNMMLRHFQPNTGRSGQRYDDRPENYTVRLIVTNTEKQAFKLETALIHNLKPRDNYVMEESLFDRDPKGVQEILDEYKYWEVEVPF